MRRSLVRLSGPESLKHHVRLGWALNVFTWRPTMSGIAVTPFTTHPGTLELGKYDNDFYGSV